MYGNIDSTNNQATVEKREELRLNILVSCILRFSTTDKGKEYSTRNISSGGICVILSHPIEINKKVLITLKLPDDSPPVTAMGRVAWNYKYNLDMKGGSRYDVGIRFVKITDKDTKRIHHFIG